MMWDRRLGTVMQQKGDIANTATVAGSGFALWLHQTNAWVAEYMPLITAVGIIGGLFAACWFYYQSIQIKRRELENSMNRRQHDQPMD